MKTFALVMTILCTLALIGIITSGTYRISKQCVRVNEGAEEYQRLMDLPITAETIVTTITISNLKLGDEILKSHTMTNTVTRSNGRITQ